MIDVRDATILWSLLIVILILFARRLQHHTRLEILPPKGQFEADKPIPDKTFKPDGYIDAFPSLGSLHIPKDVEGKEQMIRDKDLYWKLQNVEDHPGEYAGFDLLC